MNPKTFRQKNNIQPVDSLSAFLSEIDRIVKLWNPEGKEHNPWFRGHSLSSWKLTPKIYRPEFEDIKEDDLRWEFRHLAWPYLSSAAWEPKTEWIGIFSWSTTVFLPDYWIGRKVPWWLFILVCAIRRIKKRILLFGF